MSTNGFRLPEPYARFSVSLAATGALITDTDGLVLLVRPHHNPYWTFVGGMVDVGEAPHEACAREIKEEIGLDLSVGRLLVTDWAPPSDRRPLPIAYYVFDAGTVTETITPQSDEIGDFAFLPPEEATGRLAPNVAYRLGQALRSRADGRTVYSPQAE